MKQEYHTTTDHEEIRRWVESHGGRPTLIPIPNIIGGGTLSFRFSTGITDAGAKEITWVEFFEIFEERNLVLVYPAKSNPTAVNLSFKFISRNHEQ